MQAFYARSVLAGILGTLFCSTASAQLGHVVSAQKISDTAGGFDAPLDEEDQFGRSIVNLGDMDGDGISELLVGAHTDDDGGLDQGSVYVLFMRANGFVKSWTKISDVYGNFPNQLDPGDQFGRAAANVGDLDGDGVVDVAVSSNYDDDGGANKGAIYILFLNVDGTVKSFQKISSTVGGLPVPLKIHDEFGRSITPLGDMNGDGTIDLAVGTPEDDDGGTNTGALHVLFLNHNGTVKSYKRISRSTDGLRLRPGDWFGHSSANIGDFNHDGVTDLAVGSVLDDDGGVNQGSLWILYLNANGSVKESHEINELMGGFNVALDDIDQFGTSVSSIGDLDGDGVTDIAVGAVKDDDGGLPGNVDADVGAVYVLFLNADATVKSVVKISDTEGDLPYSLDQYDWFGSSLCKLGGSSADGLFNLAIGCRNDDDGSPNRGSVYLVQLNDGTAPGADFTASKTLGVAPMSVSFSGACSGEVTGFLWNFGDGPQSNLEAPLKTYTTPGVYDVSLTAKGPKGKDTEVKHSFITVSAGPLADFAATPTEGLSPLDVAFSDLSEGTVTSRSWDFGDGTSATTSAPQHVYGPGTYTVALTVSGPNGSDTKTRTALITATDLAPVAQFQATPSTGLAPLDVQFADQSSGLLTSWSWSFGDGATSTLASPQHAYLAPGTYTVALTVAGPYGSNTRTQAGCVVVQDPVPVAEFTAAPTSGFAPLAAQFSDLSTGNITSWSWTFGDGLSATERNPQHVYGASGTYTVALTVAGPDGSSTGTRSSYITVSEPPPVADFDVPSTSGFAPFTAVFTDQSSGVVATRLWSFGDGTSSSASAPQHVYAAPGSYTVSLTVSSSFGTDTVVKSNLIVVRDPTPVAHLSAPQTSGVAPLAVQFADASAGLITAWWWEFGDGATSAERDPEHVYLLPGTYSVRLSVAGPNGSDDELRTDLVVVSEPPPTADFQVSATQGFAPLGVQFTDQSLGLLSSWSWSFGDGSSSNSSSPSHVYTTPGTYDVQMTVAGPGGSDTKTIAALVAVADPLPVAAFAALPSSGIAPLTVQFTDASSGWVTGWSWSFGDGASASEASPAHVYTTPGTYSVSLVASGPTGSSTLSKNALVNVQWPAPVPEFTGGPVTGFAPLAVAFTDLSSGNITSWSWNFGDNTTSRLRFPVKVYTRTGAFTVTLTTQGPGGTRSIAHPGISVLALPALTDGGFELDVAGSAPQAPWQVVAGTNVVVQSNLTPDLDFPREGSKWLEIGAEGSAAAVPPTAPGASGAMPTGAAGVQQTFAFAPLAPHLAFDAAFLLGDAVAALDQNDFMSVDLDDGTTNWNVFYADSFSAFPLVSSKYGLPMTATRRVLVDLRTLFPAALAGTPLTLRISVGNGGDGLDASKGYVDSFRLVPVATATFRNGTGRNLARYASTPAVLGGAWNVTVDVSGHAGARMIQLVGAQHRASGAVKAAGEVLTSGKKLFAQSWVATPGVNARSIALPLDLSLMGLSMATQVTITGGQAELCNAYDLVLGF
ncbi:MAG: PKD domain-containing protein [Planctomycetes bacterium]|nr:PKD domain-containing protein [Planctomycetota bacterium]